MKPILVFLFLALFALASLACPAADPDDAASPSADAIRTKVNTLAADIAEHLGSSICPSDLLDAPSPYSAPTVFFPLPGEQPVEQNVFPIFIMIH